MPPERLSPCPGIRTHSLPNDAHTEKRSEIQGLYKFLLRAEFWRLSAHPREAAFPIGDVGRAKYL